jgi:hypothetical protein
MLDGQPECLTPLGLAHEGTDRPSPTEVLVGPGHEGPDPAGDGAKSIQVAVRQSSRPARVIEVLDKEEASWLYWHGTYPESG